MTLLEISIYAQRHIPRPQDEGLVWCEGDAKWVSFDKDCPLSTSDMIGALQEARRAADELDLKEWGVWLQLAIVRDDEEIFTESIGVNRFLTNAS